MDDAAQSAAAFLDILQKADRRPASRRRLLVIGVEPKPIRATRPGTG